MTIPLELERSEVALVVDLLKATEGEDHLELVEKIESQLISYVFKSRSN